MKANTEQNRFDTIGQWQKNPTKPNLLQAHFITESGQSAPYDAAALRNLSDTLTGQEALNVKATLSSHNLFRVKEGLTPDTSHLKNQNIQHRKLF